MFRFTVELDDVRPLVVTDDPQGPFLDPGINRIVGFADVLVEKSDRLHHLHSSLVVLISVYSFQRTSGHLFMLVK